MSEPQKPAAVAEAGKETFWQRWAFKIRVAMIFLFVVPAVLLLLVAYFILNGNDGRFERCMNRHSSISALGNDGCSDTPSYKCQSPRLPVHLMAASGVLLALSFVLGVDWICCCSYERLALEETPRVFCTIAAIFLVLELGAASGYFAWYGVFLVVDKRKHYLTNPDFSTLKSGLCCCISHNGFKESTKEWPLHLAALASATALFGTCHLLVTKKVHQRWSKMLLPTNVAQP